MTTETTLITVRTRRLTVDLRALTIRQLCRLAQINPDSQHLGDGEFLRYAVMAVRDGPSDPRDWTVQERNYIKAFYMSATIGDDADFAIGDGHLSDYLDADADYDGPRTALGGGWVMTHITGRLAESIERLEGLVDPLGSYGHWQIGALAAQLAQEDAAFPDAEGDLDEVLLARMNAIVDLSEREFAQRLVLWHRGQQQLHHLVHLGIGESGGLLILPQQGGNRLKPVRFPVDTCISKSAEAMAGKPPVSG